MTTRSKRSRARPVRRTRARPTAAQRKARKAKATAAARRRYLVENLSSRWHP